MFQTATLLKGSLRCFLGTRFFQDRFMARVGILVSVDLAAVPISMIALIIEGCIVFLVIGGD